MRRSTLLAALALFLFAGCTTKKRPPITVNIAVENSSSNALVQVELTWAGSKVPVGILSPGISATAVGVQWPFVPIATLSFVDEKSPQAHAVEVSLASINEKVRTGRCHDVTIRILGYDKGEATCG